LCQLDYTIISPPKLKTFLSLSLSKLKTLSLRMRERGCE